MSTADANVIVNVDSSSIDEYLAKYQQAMDGQSPEDLNAELDEVAEKAEAVQDNVKGSDRAVKRLVGQFVPYYNQIRQVERMVKQMQGGASGLAVVTAVLLAYQVVQQINSYLVQLEQERRDLEVVLREARGLDSREGFEGWREDQQRAIAKSRNGR